MQNNFGAQCGFKDKKPRLPTERKYYSTYIPTGAKHKNLTMCKHVYKRKENNARQASQDQRRPVPGIAGSKTNRARYRRIKGEPDQESQDQRRLVPGIAGSKANRA
jgi:hypothetical protein